MAKDWGDEPMQTVGLDTLPVPQPAEIPEIKLFGRWSCDDVQVSDMSLQVSYGYQVMINLLLFSF